MCDDLRHIYKRLSKMLLDVGDQRAYEFARETSRIEFSERNEPESVSAIRSDVSRADANDLYSMSEPN